MAETQFSSIEQIGIVVRDMEKASRQLESFGIEPFQPFKVVYAKRTLWGKPIVPVDFVKTKLAKTRVGPVEMELIQPVEGDSHWKRFMDSRGDGLQHLSFCCDDIDEVEADIAKRGFNINYTSRREGGKGAVYFETGVPGLIFEPSVRKHEVHAEPGPFGWKIQHVGVVVGDIDKAIASLKSLGVGPFQPSKLVYTKRVLWGKQIPLDSVKIRLASKQMGTLRLELIQPVEGDSHWKRFLDSTGGGMQHIGFVCDNIERAEAEVKRRGFNIIYSSRWEGDAGSCYFEIGLGDMIFEVYKPAKTA